MLGIERIARCFVAGDGYSGALGNGGQSDRTVPTLVSSGSVSFSAIASGGAMACAIQSTNGAVWCWGRHIDLVGFRRSKRRCHFYTRRCKILTAFCCRLLAGGQFGRTPALVSGVSGRSFSKLAVGGDQLACAIESSTNAAWCWGTWASCYEAVSRFGGQPASQNA